VGPAVGMLLWFAQACQWRCVAPLDSKVPFIPSILKQVEALCSLLEILMFSSLSLHHIRINTAKDICLKY
jgi:hypothetical protein